MANTDQNITELPIKTASEVLDADYMLGIDLVEGYQVSTKDFADYAVNRAAISIGGKTQTTASAISEVRTTAGNAQPKESGKGLSANDFTNSYKSKLDGIAAGAEVNVQSDWNASSGDAAILHKPTTISGYGITDAYTKTQVDTSLATKSDKATTYTKTDVDAIVNTDDDTSEAANPLVIETDAAQYAKNTHLTLEPVQDLHGYDHPWPAGGGKNLLPMTVASIKSASGLTWSGNSTTYNGITFTILTDADENVVGISTNGTSLSNTYVNIAANVTLSESLSYYLSGGVSSAQLYARVSNDEVYRDYGTGVALSPTGIITNVTIFISSGTNMDNKIFQPMIRLSTESDATFAPYSNICPITPMGHRNLLQITEQSLTHNGVVFTINDDGTIIANGTASSPVTLPIGIADGGNYIVTGCDAGGENTYGLRIGTGSNNTYHGRQHNGSDYYINTQESITVSIYVYSGQVLNNVIFKPMLRPVSDPDSTFVPYGMARVEVKSNRKNLLKNELVTKTVNGVTFTNNSDGSISLSGTASVNTLNVFVGCVYADKAMILNGYKGNWSTPGIVFHCYERGTSSPEYVTQYDGGVELPAGKIYDVSISVRQSVNTDGHIIYPMARYADVENDTYEPYQGYAASLDLPEEIYSGTLDLETGVVVADMGMVDLGTLDWTYDNSDIFFYARVTGMRFSASLSTIITAICSKYPNNGEKYNALSDKEMTTNMQSFSSLAHVLVKDSAYTDATTFKTAMSGVQLCYELATPITYQLTPQQLALFEGINNISTNAKTVQVTYRNGELATTGDIVESTEVAKQNAIGESASYTDARLATELAPILGDIATAETSPASASHAVGEYLLYNKHLYKVLAAISAGQQLTIGTNIGQTNVAAELTSLEQRLQALEAS